MLVRMKWQCIMNVVVRFSRLLLEFAMIIRAKWQTERWTDIIYTRHRSDRPVSTCIAGNCVFSSLNFSMRALTLECCHHGGFHMLHVTSRLVCGVFCSKYALIYYKYYTAWSWDKNKNWWPWEIHTIFNLTALAQLLTWPLASWGAVPVPASLRIVWISQGHGFLLYSICGYVTYLEFSECVLSFQKEQP